MNMEPRL